MSDNDLPELKSLTQMAKELGLNPSSLRTEIRKGRLRPIIIAGRFYLTPDLVREMLEACRLPVQPAVPVKRDDPDASSPSDIEAAHAAARRSIEALKQIGRAKSRKDGAPRR